jgi:hypothetical protein
VGKFVDVRSGTGQQLQQLPAAVPVSANSDCVHSPPPLTVATAAGEGPTATTQMAPLQQQLQQH